MWIKIEEDSVINMSKIIEIKRQQLFEGRYDILFCYDTGIETKSYDTEEERDIIFGAICRQLSEYYSE